MCRNWIRLEIIVYFYYEADFRYFIVYGWCMEVQLALATISIAWIICKYPIISTTMIVHRYIHIYIYKWIFTLNVCLKYKWVRWWLRVCAHCGRVWNFHRDPSHHHHESCYVCIMLITDGCFDEGGYICNIKYPHFCSNVR